MIDLVRNKSKKNLLQFSKYLAFLLRHNPSDIGLYMDTQGWVSVEELIKRLDRHEKYHIDLEILRYIVDSDSKQRYAFNDDFSLIRANQGHSLDSVNIKFKEFKPSGVLYHGTSTRFIDSIMREGLKPMSRQYVHLSKDRGVAEIVGKRHGELRVLTVDALAMSDDGFTFFESDNGVILIKEVPARYLS